MPNDPTSISTKPGPTNPRAIKKNFKLVIDLVNLTDEELEAIMETFCIDVKAFKGDYVWCGNEVLPDQIVVEEEAEA